MSALQHNAPEGRRRESEAVGEEILDKEVVLDKKENIDETVMHQKPSRSLTRHQSLGYKLQRCWFMALGLFGGLGFIASQVSFARAEGDFLINDYAADSGSGNFSVADTTFSPIGSLSNPDFTPPSAGALPDSFVDAPAAPVAVETFNYSTPAPERASYPPAQEVAPAVAEAPSITIEIEEAQPAEPEVTTVAPPTFASLTTRKKPAPTPKKVARRRNPLLGLIEASAIAAPLANLGNNAVPAVAASETSRSQTAATLNVAEIADSGATTLIAANLASAETAVETVAEPAPAVPEVLPESPSVVEAPAPVLPAPSAEAAPQPAPTPTAAETPVQPTEIVPASLPEGISLPEEYNSIFVDPTDYSVGATQSPEGISPDVVISEQSTGCEFTVENGQGVPAGACNAAPAPLGTSELSASELGAEYGQAPVANQPAAPEQSGYEQTPVASAPAVNVGPVSFSTSGIRFNSSTTAAGREYLNRSVRPMVNLQAAEQFIFPLAIPSPITSLFGFRVHPVTGQYRFHAGTDIGAAIGTPVLAVQDGTVISADHAGGYGLMVVLNHDVDNTQLESRYAHLSDILVEPGAAVKKGDVIGLVGNTGVSTGPHLHFEMLQNTADGWVLVNADGLVQNSLAKLVQALNSPMQAVNFNLADLNLNLGSIRRTPVPSEPGGATVNLPQPGRNGIPFRPAQPNAS